jgi:hypothetical protein
MTMRKRALVVGLGIALLDNTEHQRTARLKQQMVVPSSRGAEALCSVLIDVVRKIRIRRQARNAGGSRVPAPSGGTR